MSVIILIVLVLILCGSFGYGRWYGGVPGSTSGPGYGWAPGYGIVGLLFLILVLILLGVIHL